MESHTYKAFIIKGSNFKGNCLPGLNDLLGKNPYAYNELKKSMQWVVIANIRNQLNGWKPDGRIRLDITWGEKKKGKKRDYDNVVAAGRKIINDALTVSGTIEDDSPEFMEYGRNRFMYVDEPFIEVRIVEVNNEDKSK